MFLKCFGYTSSSSSSSQYPTVIEELCHKFSLADIRISTNNFDVNRIIGQGGLCTVYKGFLQRDAAASEYTTVAVKRFTVESRHREEEFKNETELLCQLRHPNLMSLIGFCNDENELIIVYEYMSNGSLDQNLHDRGDREALSWKKRLEICIGAARGLHYLHAGAKRTIIHRDIKPSNILLDHNMHPKISDFALAVQGARFMSKPKPIQVELAGTFGFIAREYFTNGAVTDKCDVYSFGVVLLVLVWGRSFHDMIWERNKKFLENPVEEDIDPNIKGKIAPECWQVFRDVMLRCWDYEADGRPTMGEVEVELEHALSLQEQADTSNNNNSDYTLFSTTIIPKRGEEDGMNWPTDSDTAESILYP